jgi:hypothetical protein
MTRLSSSLPPTSEALAGVLHAKGFELRDFEVQEEAGGAGLGELFDVVGGLLRVHCWSTGEERMYSIGAGSAWLGAFLMDLARGHFARAMRHSGRATPATA